MKKLKKIICILLAALLLASIGAVAVSAQEPAQPDMEELHQKFIAYLDEKNIGHVSPGGSGEEMSSIEYIIGLDGWNVFYGHPGYETPMPSSDRIENYVFYAVNTYAPYCIGIYAEKSGKVFPLRVACATGELDIQKVVNCDSIYISVYSPGDTDMDGSITVTDVLNIQKTICKFTEINFYDSRFNLYDYDGNNLINMKDVLDAQKIIAKLK